MRIKILLLLSVLVFSASIALAGTTLENRKKSTITVNGAIGADLMRVILAGYTDFEAGVYLGEKLQLSIGNASGVYNYSGTEDGADVDYELSLKDSYGKLRFFPGNSFNIFAGYHQRTWNGSYDWKKSIVKANITLESINTVAMLGLGNSWILDNGITIGADWGWWGASLDSSFDWDIKSSVGLTPDDKKQLNADMQTTADNLEVLSTVGGVANLRVGFSF